MTGSHPRRARDVVEELFRRQRAADDTVLDDLVAIDMVNHAAGPQGRDGLKTILRTIEVDLGPTEHLTINNVQLGSLTVANFTGVTSGSGMAVLPPPEPANPTVYRQFKADYADIVIAAGVTQYGLMSNGI